MISAAQPSGRRPAGRGFVLLVLAVLAGVLAMHGLGPRPAAAAVPPAAMGGHVMAMPQQAAAQHADAGCSHTTGSPDHLSHADGTCAAAGVGAPYAPPALASAPAGAPGGAVRPRRVAESTGVGRAPPDLAELQLLRI